MTRRSWLILTAGVCRADAPLEAKWRKIAADTDGVVGAAALQVATGRRASLNGDQPFPLASVCKLPIAMCIHALAAEGKLSLKQQIDSPKDDVVLTVSSIGEQWEKRKKWPLDEMIHLMIAKSDNTAVQTLYRLAGGGEAITARLKSWGIRGVRIDRDERSIGDFARGNMRRLIDDPRDTGTPDSTVNLVVKALANPALRANLQATTTGPKRIGGLLPPGTIIGHKTGTTGSEGKLNGGTNDAGFIRLPDGSDLVVVFYLKGSTRPLEAREKVIARLARAAYDWAITSK
jgi:beta-lactamase class A